MGRGQRLKAKVVLERFTVTLEKCAQMHSDFSRKTISRTFSNKFIFFAE